MVKYIILALMFASFGALAEYTYNKPLIILLDENKNKVEGVTGSTDYARCLQKASNLSAGTYYCQQPDIRVNVTQESNETVISWDAPTEFTDNTKIDKIDEFRIYINDEPVTLTGDKSTHVVSLPTGNHSFYVTAVVNNIESSASNTVTKTIN